VSVSQSKAKDEDFDEEAPTLAEFFLEFIERHAVQGQEADEVTLNVSPAECETLGRSFIQIMTGWAFGLISPEERKRFQRLMWRRRRRGGQQGAVHIPKRGILPVGNRGDDLKDIDEDTLEDFDETEGPIH